MLTGLFPNGMTDCKTVHLSFEVHGERRELPKARISEVRIAERVNSRARASHAQFPRSLETEFSSRAFSRPTSAKNADCFTVLTDQKRSVTKKTTAMNNKGRLLYDNVCTTAKVFFPLNGKGLMRTNEKKK